MKSEPKVEPHAAALEAPSEPEELPPHIASILEQDAQEPQLQRLPELGVALVIDLRDDEVDLKIGELTLTGTLAPSVHPSVIRTASSRGEMVLIQRAASGVVTVVGALRTQPTPGVDAMETIHLEAETIHLHGRKEVLVSTSGPARLALRAAGEIETYATRIVSRAEELHKIVGRMLRLN